MRALERRMSQMRTAPSTEPLARMCSWMGDQATERTAPEELPVWPGERRDWMAAEERRSTRRTAACWVAQATRRWGAMGEVACVYTLAPRSKEPETRALAVDHSLRVWSKEDERKASSSNG